MDVILVNDDRLEEALQLLPPPFIWTGGAGIKIPA
jgi:hypothetical protein